MRRRLVQRLTRRPTRRRRRDVGFDDWAHRWLLLSRNPSAPPPPSVGRVSWRAPWCRRQHSDRWVHTCPPEQNNNFDIPETCHKREHSRTMKSLRFMMHVYAGGLRGALQGCLWLNLLFGCTHACSALKGALRVSPYCEP